MMAPSLDVHFPLAEDYYLAPDLRKKYLLDEPVLFDEESTKSSAQIDWEPDLETYEARTARRLRDGGLITTLPETWPHNLPSPLAWKAEDLEDENEYVLTLTKDEKAEIHAALTHFQGLKLELGSINMDTFPLGRFAIQLRALAVELHSGRGFFVLRGLDPKLYTGEQNAIIFIGISCYIGETRGRQDREGKMLGHILDSQGPEIEPSERLEVFTTLSQPFHNDVVCDILALHTRGTAAKGGNSIIASAYTVYNELAATRPDLIHELASPNWAFDTFGRIPAYHKRPLLYWHAGNLILNFSRRSITGSSASPRSEGLPPITEAQAEALDAIHFIAAKHSLTMKMQAGDFRFINNLAILHCRDAFENDQNVKRHLVRLWLRNEKLAWPTPPKLQMAWDRIYKHDPTIEDVWEVDGLMRPDHVVSKKMSCGFG